MVQFLTGSCVQESKQHSNVTTSKRVTYAADYFGGVPSSLMLMNGVDNDTNEGTKGNVDAHSIYSSPATRKRSLSDSNIDCKLAYQSFFTHPITPLESTVNDVGIRRDSINEGNQQRNRSKSSASGMLFHYIVDCNNEAWKLCVPPYQ